MAVVSWFVVLPLLLCLFPLCYGEQKIRLKLKYDKQRGHKCVCKEKYIFNDKEPTKIYIENTDYLDYNKCYAETNPDQTLKITQFSGPMKNRVWMASVLHYVHGNVVCKFNYEANKTMSCNFAIEVKYTDGLKAYINGGLLKSKKTGRQEVDLETEVYLSARELVNIKCVKPPDVLGTLEFVYGSQYNMLNVTEQINEIEIQKIMVSDHYIHCKFLKMGAETATVLRISLMLRSDQENNTIKINDVIIRPYENTILLYMYSGDRPKVICNGTPIPVQMNDTVDGPVALAKCEIRNKTRTLKLFKNISCKDVINANGDNFDKLTQSDINTSTMKEGNGELILTRLYCVTDSSFIHQFVTIPEVFQDDKNAANITGGNSNGHTAAIVGGILSIILVLLVVGLVVVYSKRRKHVLACEQCTIDEHVERDGLAEQLSRRQNQIDNESTKLIQENSTNTTENPYSVPYSRINVSEDFYAEPNVKGDVQYAEIGDFHRYVNRDGERAVKNNRPGDAEPAYSEVVTCRLEDLYTKVIPKRERN